MSETTGGVTAHLPKGRTSYDSAGIPMPGSIMTISNPDKDGVGEITMGGRHIMMGYLKNKKATRETMDQNGCVRSGDLAKFSKEGFLYITGRIKELIITAGGENVAPILIEDTFKDECHIISNVMAIGEGRPFISALITLKVDVDL